MNADYRAVRLTGGFWKEKEDLNKNITLPAVYSRFEETGRIEAFKFNWKEGMPNRPHFFWDSDVAKWIEGAAYALSREKIPQLEEQVEEIIDNIEKNQGEDGYFNIYFTVVSPDKRFFNRDWHELYCAGHLIEAAVAYYKATGKDRFLKIMEKYAGYIKSVFIDKTAPEKANFSTPGHQEIELALYKLYKCTGNKEWLEMSEYFLEKRGTEEDYLPEGEFYSKGKNVQSHMPAWEQKDAVGHCVRACYMYAAMADVAKEANDETMKQVCRNLYKDIVNGKMYITGGVGSTHYGEAFTIPNDLPNDLAYTETCASIAMAYFAHRMFLMDKESCYADIVEKEMYNGILSGLSLKGDSFFYENPLEIHLNNYKKVGSRYPITSRQKLFSCSCCPPNMNRFLASAGEYFYGWEDGILWINQFGESTFEAEGIKASQKTEYPLNGKVCINTRGTKEVRVRIPEWCKEINADKKYKTEKGYACFNGEGQINITFKMEPLFIQSRVGVYKNLDKVAVQYGPVIYCAEGIDNQEDVHSLYLNVKEPAWQKEYWEEAGLWKLSCEGYRRQDGAESLYYPLTESFVKTRINLIPYHTFANRGDNNMLVFMGYR